MSDTHISLHNRVVQDIQTDHYRRLHEIKNGIEWISYFPTQRNQFPPILMQHGMWHGAWCWQDWQACFAEWGWESHAISLPGHGLSPLQRPIWRCTLGYYLQFVCAAVDALPQKPILMGHSMGGAISQWYLRDVGDLPAAVLVAPWALYGGYWACTMAWGRLNADGGLGLGFRNRRCEWIGIPQQTARFLISPNATLTAEALHERLTPESGLVLLQHLRPWRVPSRLTTPILWLGAEHDAAIPEFAARRAAAIYPTGEYRLIVGAAHNIMMEANYRAIAQDVADWLIQREC